MPKSLLWKLILAFMLVALITAGLVAVFIRATSLDRLTRLIVEQQVSNLQNSAGNYYTTHGSWTGVADEWSQLARPFPTPADNTGGPRFPGQVIRREGRRLFGLADASGRVVISIDPGYPPGSVLPATVLDSSSPVNVNGQRVGSILVPRGLPGLNPEENLFLQRTNQALLMAVAGALLVALLIGFVLARTLIRPLQAMTRAAQNMAEGELSQQVQVKSQDELGQLAGAFNRMSAEVNRANQQRRQMTADIAHDLRTPLTVIAGYIESMRDGVLKPTPERMALIYKEIERLQNLVGDLRMLSQVDAGELPLHTQPIEPRGLLEQAAATFQHRAGQQQVELVVQAAGQLPTICVDEARMMQVFGNLLINAIRYTPPGGKIILNGTPAQDHVILSVEDNGEGIAEEDLPFIFDRFQRADKSRHAEAGQSGLGLAIVKALVEAQGGTVRAESRAGQGTQVVITFPAA